MNNDVRTMNRPTNEDTHIGRTQGTLNFCSLEINKNTNTEKFQNETNMKINRQIVNLSTTKKKYCNSYDCYESNTSNLNMNTTYK